MVKDSSELERATIKDYFKFYNELAKKYPESELVYSTEAGITRKNYLIELLERDPESFTLDLGCNDGPFKPHIKRYVGLDIASACLGRFKAPALQGLAQNLPFRRGVFDRILASEVLEHIWDRYQVLRECRRVLKRGGEIIVSVPYGRNPYRLYSEDFVPLFRRYEIEFIPYVHGRFSKENARSLLEENGFAIKRLEQLGNFNIIAIGVNQ